MKNLKEYEYQDLLRDWNINFRPKLDKIKLEKSVNGNYYVQFIIMTGADSVGSIIIELKKHANKIYMQIVAEDIEDAIIYSSKLTPFNSDELIKITDSVLKNSGFDNVYLF